MKITEIASTAKRSNRQEMYDQIVWQIRSGRLQAGTALESTAVLAKRFGVALMTAQRTLQDLVKDGYILREPGKRTRVAQSPGTGRAMSRGDNIGVMLPQMGAPLTSQESPFHFAYVQGIVSGANRHRKHVTILSAAGEMIEPQELLRMGLYGIICVVPKSGDREYLCRVRDTGIPLVLITPRPCTDFSGFLGVERNYGDVGRQALNHFLSKGKRRMVFVTATCLFWESHQYMLMHGFAEAAMERDVRFSVLELFLPRATSSEVRQCMDLMKERLSAYDAAICSEDVVGDAVHSLYPEMEIVSLHWANGMSTPEYTHFHVSNEELGMQATDLLCKSVEDASMPREIHFLPLALSEPDSEVRQ